MSRPVRVLQVVTCDGIGGTETMVASLVERLDPTVVSSEVATLSGRGRPVAERLQGVGVRVRELGRDAPLSLAFGRLGKVIGQERYDVVCAYGLKGTALTRLATRGLSRHTRFVCGVRGLLVTESERVDAPKAKAAAGIEILGSGLVDVYDANSKGALDLLANLGVPRHKLRYIPNGLEPAAWPTAPLADTEEPIVLCVSRFVARKRQLDLVRAAEELARRRVSFRVIFVGDGPKLHEVKAAAEAGSAANHIEFRGGLEPAAVRETMAEADVACLCSMWEGMANAVMEAMACGLPVVGTDVNGIADLVIPDVTGLLVPAKGPAELANALAALLTNVGARRRLGQAGRAYLEQSFTVDAMVAAKANLYGELAGLA